MSRENVEIVRRLFAEFGLSIMGVEAAARAGLIAADAQFDYSALYLDGPTVRGIEGYRDFVDSLPWGRSLTLTPERLFDVDDERVLAFVHAAAEGEGSGVAVEGSSASELTIRNKAIVRVKIYLDRSKALEAAGLSE
jgi:ketosteroid isomerase-like protein